MYHRGNRLTEIGVRGGDNLLVVAIFDGLREQQNLNKETILGHTWSLRTTKKKKMAVPCKNEIKACMLCGCDYVHSVQRSITDEYNVACITWSELKIRKTVARDSVSSLTANSPITHVKPRRGRIIMKDLKSFLHNGNKEYVFIVYIYDNESTYKNPVS